VEQKRYR